jgi:hypothetical protein
MSMAAANSGIPQSAALSGRVRRSLHTQPLAQSTAFWPIMTSSKFLGGFEGKEKALPSRESFSCMGREGVEPSPDLSERILSH